MSSCIICGKSVDGRVCDLHQEDVVFEFEGTRPDQLSIDRFYRGTVDGYADFGVFIDIGDQVTGLLHRSELDRRLDSLEWEPGDTVFVQVQNVRDNGNVDLGWSIRQDETEFRGTLIDDPEAGEQVVDESGNGRSGSGESAARDESDDNGASTGGGTAGDGGTTPAGSGAAAVQEPADREDESADTEPVTGAEADADTEADIAAEPETEPEPASREPTQLTVDRLGDNVGEFVRLEGEIVEARQTSGPTVFTLRDETGEVECAAFESAGVRAYPEVAEDDVVRLEGEVERRRGDLQVETEGLVVLTDEERATVTERMDEAMVERARPPAVDPLVDDPAVETVSEALRDAATAIRRAVLEGRPVVIRHNATADGYAAGVAIERATLPLVREEHAASDAVYHYFDRRPLEGRVYDMEDATKDVTTMLSNRERHDEALPLFVFVGVGSTEASLDGLELLSLYDARRVVVDDAGGDETVADTVDLLVSPDEEYARETTATALSATLAAHVNEEVREDLSHLPAVSFWEGAPEGYLDLAADAGYDAETVAEVREAIALEAFYQSYEDKRELITDLLFPQDAADDDVETLASHVSEQFRTKMDTEVETAEANLESVDVDGGTVLVLDADAFTHRFEFPPVALLLDELWRRHRSEATALLGLNTDVCHVRTDADVDVRSLTDDAAMAAPAAGFDVLSPRDGQIEFLSGEREAAREALLEALGDRL